jgi:hypothetical protein
MLRLRLAYLVGVVLLLASVLQLSDCDDKPLVPLSQKDPIDIWRDASRTAAEVINLDRQIPEFASLEESSVSQASLIPPSLLFRPSPKPSLLTPPFRAAL